MEDQEAQVNYFVCLNGSVCPNISVCPNDTVYTTYPCPKGEEKAPRVALMGVIIKFIDSEKATKFYEIFTLLLTGTT